MQNKQHSSQGSREQGFELSYKLAYEQLSKISNIEEQCHKSGARYIGPNKVVIDYLNQPYHIILPDAEITLEDGNAEIPVKDKILILHYFTLAKGTPPTGILINYKQLPGGVSYFPAFTQRAINPWSTLPICQGPVITPKRLIMAFIP